MLSSHINICTIFKYVFVHQAYKDLSKGGFSVGCLRLITNTNKASHISWTKRLLLTNDFKKELLGYTFICMHWASSYLYSFIKFSYLCQEDLRKSFPNPRSGTHSKYPTTVSFLTYLNWVLIRAHYLRLTHLCFCVAKSIFTDNSKTQKLCVLFDFSLKDLVVSLILKKYDFFFTKSKRVMACESEIHFNLSVLISLQNLWHNC